MEIRYKRDLNSNYMILTEENPKNESYEVRMITENRIYGLLPCIHQQYEGRTEYYYEITGRQSMELLYERRKLNSGQLKGLLRELLRILESAGEYLLNPDHLLLGPETIYLHTRSEKLYLCCYPGSEKKIQESFLDLAEYLLGKLDKSDAEGIEFGYELYQNALEPNFSLTELLHRHTETEKEAPQPAVRPAETVSVQKEILEKTGSWKNFFKKKNRQTTLEDYVAEADQMGSGTALFLKEEALPETACLQKVKRDGLFLRSLSTEYPSFQIQEEAFLLGKKKDSVDGCIPAPTISRIHARITCDGGIYYVEDLNSTNGTWADQMQLNPYELYPLKAGMYLTFASVEYEVEL
ncbi:MAG: FHA domain-containing protein [Lachnospiraceae bacterium]|nr:FHA domain-containing protein [Lachnospiraceae bacterium]